MLQQDLSDADDRSAMKRNLASELLRLVSAVLLVRNTTESFKPCMLASMRNGNGRGTVRVKWICSKANWQSANMLRRELHPLCRRVIADGVNSDSLLSLVILSRNS